MSIKNENPLSEEEDCDNASSMETNYFKPFFKLHTVYKLQDQFQSAEIPGQGLKHWKSYAYLLDWAFTKHSNQMNKNNCLESYVRFLSNKTCRQQKWIHVLCIDNREHIVQVVGWG